MTKKNSPVNMLLLLLGVGGASFLAWKIFQGGQKVDYKKMPLTSTMLSNFYDYLSRLGIDSGNLEFMQEEVGSKSEFVKEWGGKGYSVADLYDGWSSELKKIYPDLTPDGFWAMLR